MINQKVWFITGASKGFGLEITKAAANAEKPPVHLPLGNDTLAMYREKTAKFEKDIEDWYDVITGTDHDDVRG
ncbi:hypothetical protein [Paenibacillus alginolyticus]|uniref:Short-chain dehydrogenase n=1 Tax=Paenibacillus alginolyticus TaxID=59839 RepID=A0ABT4GLA1_9BACL|nr:hypothetical protein [Paenibacillus alginolyticus]MCY9696940.1 hypothetical protein [Paenibacillus alginolyticus]MEC0145794.1 hypothetical protein [Paenibacillus alginolyticus]